MQGKKGEKELTRTATVKRIVPVALNIGCHQLWSFLLRRSEPLFSKISLLKLEAVKKTVKIISMKCFTLEEILK